MLQFVLDMKAQGVVRHIGLSNDLARQGDTLAREHYLTLEKTAADCIQCGHYNSRCPFQVAQQERMAEISAYLGK